MNCEECKKNKVETKDSFAMELLKDYSKQARKWFISCILISCFWLATICGFIWFLNQYNFESYIQDGNGVNCIHTTVGGDIYNGSEIQSND